MKALQLVRHTLFVMLLTAVVPAGAAVQLPGPLVDADWLMQNIDDVRILDVRKDTDSFLKEGHIEGAVLVNARKIRVDRTQDGNELTGMLPDRAQYEAFMAAHGVSNDATVVITHRGIKAGNVAGAARLYWHMKYYGFERVALLDGGNQAWTDALGDLTTDATAVEAATLTAGTEQALYVAKKADVLKALHSDDVQLVDTRNLRFHIGLEKRDYVYDFGHIPGSRLFPHRFLHPEKGATVYFENDVIASTLRALDIDADKELILYCNSAYECSSVWFALHELMGKEDVRIYDGSLNEWTQDARYPMTRTVSN